MKKHNIQRTPPQQAERYSPDVREGLSDAQAARRVSEGLNNVVSASQGKSYGRILRDNLMTVFNLLNFALAACVILVVFQRAVHRRNHMQYNYRHISGDTR